MKYKDGDESKFELWRINKLLFNEFTKTIPKEVKKMPTYVRKMIKK